MCAPVFKTTIAIVSFMLAADLFAGQQSNNSPVLGEYTNTLLAYAAYPAVDLALMSSSLFKNANESLMFAISRIKAQYVFWDAYRTVPAYQDFVNKRCPTLPEHFSDLPLISKKAYIEQYSLKQLYKGGTIPAVGYMDPSSGTSGRRTLWIRGKDEVSSPPPKAVA